MDLQTMLLGLRQDDVRREQDMVCGYGDEMR